MQRVRSFGFFDDKEVKIITLISGKWKVEVSTFGATLIYYGTSSYNAITTLPTLLDYISDSSAMGKVIGPFANRIENASFSLDGEKYFLDKNDGENTLHSGLANYGNMVWDIVGVSDSSLTLTLFSPEKGGFPGEKEVEVTYSLTEDGVLTIYYRATSSKKCPVNLTNHAYFVLDDRDCRYITLKLPAKYYIAVDSSLIPLVDNPTKVENTDFDFNTPTLIISRRNGNYDNSWVLEKNSVIECEGNRAKLYCRTTENAVQVYTAQFLGGPFYKAYGGIALETGKYPNTPNRLDFPQFYTEKDKIYESSTSYCLEVKE